MHFPTGLALKRPENIIAPEFLSFFMKYQTLEISPFLFDAGTVPFT